MELLDENGTSQYKSDLREPILTEEENKTGVVPPFNAYSAPGDITVCIQSFTHISEIITVSSKARFN